jgi:hypothetical protein
MVDKNDLSRMSKRRFMKTAAGLGIGATTLQVASRDAIVAAADDHDKEVVYPKYVEYRQPEDPSKEPERNPVLTTMPREKWSRNHAAGNLAESLNQQINQWSSPEYIQAWLKGMDDSPIKYGVEVEYQVIHTHKGMVEPALSIEKVRSRLPSKGSASAGDGEHRREYDNIPVKVKEKESAEVAMHCQYDEVPGGCSCNVEGYAGTIMAPFSSNDYNDSGWAFSGHVAASGGGDGAVMCQPNSDETGVVEIVKDQGSEKDYAWAQSEYAETVRRSLRDPAQDACSSFIPIKGIVPDSAIQNDVDSSTTYYVQGNQSRRKSGTIGAFYDNTGGDPSDNRYNHSADLQDGDSGGPLYKMRSGDAYIAGLADEDLYYGGNAGNTAEACEDVDGLDGYFLAQNTDGSIE